MAKHKFYQQEEIKFYGKTLFFWLNFQVVPLENIAKFIFLCDGKKVRQKNTLMNVFVSLGRLWICESRKTSFSVWIYEGF